MHFKELGLHPDILRAIVDAGYETPTPIQAEAIPHILQGLDVMGAAQTGTGKTAAFTLPILHRLMPLASHSASPARHPVRALMLAPTRELADQIYQNVRQYAQHTPLRSAVVFGGMDMAPQTAQLRSGVEVLIATPGRLLDHVEQKTVNLSQVTMLVLDEADRMLDMGFLPDLSRIVKLLPAQRQSLLFSATFSPEIRKLGKTFLNENPVSVEVARRNAMAENVTQTVFKVGSVDEKRAALVQILQERDLRQLIVFSNTKIGCGRLARELVREDIPAEAIHGDRTQAERLATLDRFKAGEVRVLVATDVAARGLDIAELPAVINFDLPHTPEDYVHRIGRTGRAGASGEAIALMTDSDARALADIEKLVGRKYQIQDLQVKRVSRPRVEESMSGRESRDAREGRSGYEGRGERSASSGRGRARPLDVEGIASRRTKAPADPIFSQPYDDSAVPAELNSAAPVRRLMNSIFRKRSKAALLGGLPPASKSD